MKRRCPSRNYALHKMSRRAKCGRDFARIQHADAPAAAGAHVKQVSTVPQRLSDDFDCARKIGRCSTQRLLNEPFLLNKQLNQFLRAHFFQVFRARIALFR
jgi:hypothetical protein